MTYAIDTNIIYDICTADDEFGPRSRDFLAKLHVNGDNLIACDVVWAEASAGFPDKEAFARQMADFGIAFSPMPESAAILAGSIWKRARTTLAKAKKPRLSIIPDFLIGAHALECADALVTRDRGFTRTWFAELRTIDPMKAS